MTSREHYDPKAGPWVAYREMNGRRDYLWKAGRSPLGGLVLSGRPDDCVRFDTKAEAESHIRRLYGRRRGVRTGAARCPTEETP